MSNCWKSHAAGHILLFKESLLEQDKKYAIPMISTAYCQGEQFKLEEIPLFLFCFSVLHFFPQLQSNHVNSKSSGLEDLF